MPAARSPPTSSATTTTPASACCAPPSRSRSSRWRSASRPTSRSRTRCWRRASAAAPASRPAYVMSLREFAAAWEYLIPSAIFTAPAHSEWSGAALVSRDGKLVGVGSLVVGDVTGQGKNLPGNMYVPIDLLPPIMADLLSERPRRRPGPAVARAQCRGGARPHLREPRHRRRAGASRPASSAATSSSPSTARRRGRSPTSIARSGRWAAPARRCRSTCCRTAASSASTSSRSTASITCG